MSRLSNEKAVSVFSEYASFIKDYIYKNDWAELREAQIDAGDIIFHSDSNLVISSSTATGKTEAAFFPVLSELAKNPSSSIGVLYIAPTKALINDQYDRLCDVLDATDIKVTKWHGDAQLSKKDKLLKDPSGVLQITPESLESILFNHSSDLIRLFCDLRFVIIDEVHTVMSSDRGSQVKCLIERIIRKTGNLPRIIALSATMGCVEKVAEWVGAGTGRDTRIVDIKNSNVHWRLMCEQFFVDTESHDQIDAGYEYVFKSSYDKKSIIFSNSREETESVCASMRQICRKKGLDDRFYIHHGNLSATIREETERALKNDEKKSVACATVTLELGIDIGKLERVVNIESPNTVSGFLQRLGRSGRRNTPSEMVAVFREITPLPYAPFYETVSWHLLQMIAIVELYLKERFVEPPYPKHLPFSLLFHQTLSFLSSNPDITPATLAKNILSISPFSNVPREDYKELLISMIKNDFIEQTDEGKLLVGMRGEQITNNFKFYAVFPDSEDYSVKCGAEEIGTISSPVAVGERFALAGRVWEVKELDLQHKLIFVVRVEGKMEIAWPGSSGAIHIKIIEKIREILSSDTEYSYLGKKARERLLSARKIARETGFLKHSVLCLGGCSYVMFPWLGTKGVRALKNVLKTSCKDEFGISSVSSFSCYYLTFKMEKKTPAELLEFLEKTLTNNDFCELDYVIDSDVLISEKFDRFIPQNLLKKAFARDCLEFDDLRDKCRRKFKNE